MPKAPLSAHLAAQNVEFMQFAFRWMNCLLMREISVQNTIRMWDTYLVRPAESMHMQVTNALVQAEGTDAFSQFHLYVCSAFLVRWSDKLQEMDFQVCLRNLLRFSHLNHFVGHHYVPPIPSHPRLDRQRYRAAAQPRVCAQLHLAQRTKSLLEVA